MVCYDEVYSLILCIEYDDGSGGGDDDDGDYYDDDDLTDNDESDRGMFSECNNLE